MISGSLGRSALQAFSLRVSKLVEIKEENLSGLLLSASGNRSQKGLDRNNPNLI
jgi:hypothetical protein